MKSAAALVTAAALVLASAVLVTAQAKPNFAGKWVQEAAEAPAGGGGRGGGRGGGLGQELTITQDATMLKIDYVGGGRNPGPVSLTYKLDGSESTNPGFGGTDQTSKAMWDGNKLVVTTNLMMGGTAVEQKRVLSMEGANLIVETVQPGRDGGPGTPSRLVYKKGA